eukprot:5275548-Karenia_brevis.AAC.1
MCGIVRVSAQDVAEIRADLKFEPHRVKVTPALVSTPSGKVQLPHEELAARTAQILQSTSRQLDTSNWLG